MHYWRRVFSRRAALVAFVLLTRRQFVFGETMEFNLPLFQEEMVSAVACIDEACTDRSWCCPSLHADVIGIDFGKQGMCAYFSSTGKHVAVPFGGEMTWLSSIQRGCLVVCEWAHLAVPQTDRSLAQFFTAQQLTAIYCLLEQNGVTLRLFPHYHSGPRARAWAANRFPLIVTTDKSDDKNDAAAIALYVKHCNGVSLAKPPRNFGRCPRRDYGLRVIDSANVVLNAERVRGYEGRKFPLVVALARKIRKKSYSSFIDHDRAVTVAALIATEVDGKPKLFCRNGRPPGARFWMRYVARFTPFHHRGGIARSNLLKHRFPPFLVRHAARNGVSVKSGSKRIPFGSFDHLQDGVRRATFKVVRCAVIEAYRIGVDEAIKMGFEPYEI